MLRTHVVRPAGRVAMGLVLAVGPVACGGGAADDGVGGEFAGRAKQVCADALASKRDWAPFPVAGFDPNHPDTAALPQVAAWLQDEVAPTFDAWLGGLRSLGTPPTAKDAWADVIAAVQRIVDQNGEQIAAARDGDADAFAAATNGLEQTQAKLEAATDAAGVSSCADVHA